eukprot:RCo005261
MAAPPRPGGWALQGTPSSSVSPEEGDPEPRRVGFILSSSSSSSISWSTASNLFLPALPHPGAVTPCMSRLSRLFLYSIGTLCRAVLCCRADGFGGFFVLVRRREVGGGLREVCSHRWGLGGGLSAAAVADQRALPVAPSSSATLNRYTFPCACSEAVVGQVSICPKKK